MAIDWKAFYANGGYSNEKSDPESYNDGCDDYDDECDEDVDIYFDDYDYTDRS